MPKHPVPKQKTPKSKVKKRYGTFKTGVLKRLSASANLCVCKSCGAKKLNHHVCHECGKYRDRQVLNKQKEIEKITKIKA